MQIKRWISTARRYSSLGVDPKEKKRIFWLYLKVAWLKDRGRWLKSAEKLNLIWEEKPFEFLIREKLDFEALAHIFLDGEYPLSNLGFPSTIIDVGSNIGVSVIWFKLAFPNSDVIAIEADPTNLEALNINVRQFGDSVRIIDKAIFSSEGETLTFYTSQKGHMSSSLYRRRDDDIKINVISTTLDIIVDDFSLSNIDLLKFDIEGGEYDMLAHFSSLNNVKKIVGEVHKDLMPVKVYEFMSLFEASHNLILGSEALADDRQRKSIVFLESKNMIKNCAD